MAGAIRGITVEIGGDTTKLGKALADVNKKSKDLQSELNGVNSLLKMDPGNVTLLKQKQDLLNKSIETTKEKLEKLKSAQAQVQDQFDKGEITEEQFRDFQREIEATKQKLKSLKDQMSDFGSVAAQKISLAGEKVSEFGDKISGAGEKLLPLTGAVAAAGTAVVMTADDLKSATNTYLTATGTAAEGTMVLDNGIEVLSDNMEKYKGVIEDIYANNYGESFEDIADSMAKVTTNMGEIDGSQLQAATESALALRDTFDFDVNESTRTAKMLMDQYGMSAEDAFNLIVQGAQNGLDKNGDLLDTINEYAVHFEGLGLGAEDMFNMLVNGAKNGTFSVDKLGDAVKEFGIRVKDGTADDAFKALGFSIKDTKKAFAEGGEGAKQALKDVTDALFAMEDPVKQNQLGVELFGTMWEDLGVEGIKALTDMNGEISTTNAAMDTLKEQKYDNLTNQLETLGRNFTTNVMVPLGETLLPIITSLVDKISEWVAKFGELSPEAQKIIFIVSAIAAAIGPVLIIIGKVISAIGTVMTWVPKIVSGLKAVFGLIAANPVVAIIAAIIAVLVLLYNKCEWFRDGVNAVIAAVISFFKNLGPSLVEIFNNIKSKISTWWTNLSSNFKTQATNIITSTTNFFKGLPGKIYSAIQSTIAKVSSWGSQMLSTAKNKMASVVSGIVSTFSNLPSQMTSIGRNVIQGIINGISGMVSKLYSSIKNALSGLVNKAKSALGIHSPSRVFRDTIGAMIPSGIAVGIQKNEDVATDAVEDMVNELAAQELSINGATINRKLNTTFGQDLAANSAANTLDPANLMSTLREIRDRLSRLQIVLDSGELVGGIIDPIDSALNNKYSKVARGW